MSFTIKQPETDDDFEQYYYLRWRILRARWGEPEGSEVDDREDRCYHIMAVESNRVVGVGRLQYNSAEEAQIRYMAVSEEYTGNGIGRQIVSALEQQAVDQNMSTIVLDAREPAVGFYQKLDYRVEKKSYLLFDEIQHYRMIKRL